MATVIEPSDGEIVREVHHDHYTSTSEDNGIGAVLGIILGLVLLAILLFYGLPLFRNALENRSTSGTINVNVQGLPNTNTGETTNGGTTP